MNKLSIEKQVLILQSLCEGNSIRSTERLSNTHRDTIMRLLVSAGNRAQETMNEKFVNLKSNYIQADEIWTYCYKKRTTQSKDEKKNIEIGDQYVFVAMDSETKLVPAFYVGKRNLDSTVTFINQRRERIVNRFQLSTDSFPAYCEAVNESFGENIEFAQISKMYANDNQYERRYSPPKIICLHKKWINGNPEFSRISTSHIERQNLTMRMNMRRFTRLTNAFSKKLENLKCACSLHFFYYNFMRVHQTLKSTPAMESNITNRIWSWEEFLGISVKQKQVA
ncbi:MAG: hypothetical protein NTZ27_08350 [Ignavibacteriales bacterium]|nr:hypothetical protein [Ignavibacteriales bacterium]